MKSGNRLFRHWSILHLPGPACPLAAGLGSFLEGTGMALSLVQVVAEKTNALRVLEDAFNAQLNLDGGHAIMLDSVLQTARARGFYGSQELAAGVLQVSGRFRIEKGSVGKWQAVRQSTALVPVCEPRSTALVPVAAG